MIIASVLVYTRLLDASTGDRRTRASPCSSRSLDVVLATVALLLVLRPRGADRPVLAWSPRGFILYAVADLAFSVLAGQDRFHFGTPLDLGWIAGYLAIGLAASVPEATGRGHPSTPRRPLGRARHDGGVRSSWWPRWSSSVQATTAACRPRRPCMWLLLILRGDPAEPAGRATTPRCATASSGGSASRPPTCGRLARQTEVLLSSVGDGIYGVDLDGRVTFVDPSGARPWATPPRSCTAQAPTTASTPPTEDGLPFPWSGCYVDGGDRRRGGRRRRRRTSTSAPTAAAFPVEITASPIVDRTRCAAPWWCSATSPSVARSTA